MFFRLKDIAIGELKLYILFYWKDSPILKKIMNSVHLFFDNLKKSQNTLLALG